MPNVEYGTIVAFVTCAVGLAPIGQGFAQEADTEKSEAHASGEHAQSDGNGERDEEADDEKTGKGDESNASAQEEDDYDEPALPEGMTLEEVLDRAAKPPPEEYPESVPDDRVYAFLLAEQLEYRLPDSGSAGHVGLELQGWLGGDYNKLWWKNESEGAVVQPRGLETETDLLYSRLITPFWSAQIGVQYANEIEADAYEDRWSGALALQGLAPGKFEVDVSVYVSQNADVTAELEGEYDIRITQRLVLQPLVGLGFSAQDIPERAIGAGMTDAVVDLRLRYEILREFAPYLGGRWRVLVGETADRAEAAGVDPNRLLLLGGFRFAIL